MKLIEITESICKDLNGLRTSFKDCDPSLCDGIHL